MEGKVKLTITGIQSGFGQKDRSEICTMADCYEKNGTCYLFYSEYTEEGLVLKNRLTIAPDFVELRKTGHGISVLTFKKGERNSCTYQSPVGPMIMESETGKIRFRSGEKELRLDLEYTLYMGGAPVSDYSLRVSARKTEEA